VTEMRVELIDNVDDLVLASRTVGVASIQATEQLYVVVTQSAAGSIDMTGAAAPGLVARQANWEVETIPDNAAALESINTLVFTDVDTAGLTLPQQAALEAWVAGGGHLVVTGGPRWESTSEGVSNLLPLVPDDSMTMGDLAPLAAFLGDDNTLAADTTVATGDLIDGAVVLSQTFDSIPLLARRTLGDGTVDYLAADPNTVPLRGWERTSDLWYLLASTRDPLPTWAGVFSQWEAATISSEILPGLDVLPSVLPLCGFLALYIALIGPLNYVVLNRINRREYAWLTIPVFILLFSGLAWIVGGELRGNDPSIGRVTMVRSWPDTEIAHTSELIGLLSPQRTQYTLEVDEGSFLRTIPDTNLVTGSGGILQSSFQSSIEIQQESGFRGFEFPVDASFVAGFATYGTIEKPEISGTVTMLYPEDENNVQIIRGSVTNRTEQTLTDGVILARGSAYNIPEPIEPGDVAAFPFINANQIRLEGGEMASPAPIGYNFTRASLSFGTSSFNGGVDGTVRDIMNNNVVYNPLFPGNLDANTIEDQEQRRRQLFLSSVIQDPLYTTSRGNNVYFVGWAEGSPTTVALQERDHRPFDTTVYIVELETEIEQPAGTPVRVSGDQFVWSVHERSGLGSAVPVNLRVPEGDSVAFRYTPLPSAQLETVTELEILLQFNSGGQPPFNLQLWNWETGEWNDHQAQNGELVFSARADIRSYVGPQNAVILRVPGGGFYNDVQTIRVEQYGLFSS
ncbi:MAG: hypothetical protein AAFV33_12410, partial [Chloroflexota bacterium]